MHIGIYTLFLTPGHIGGIETYLRHLVAMLGQVDRVNQYTLFVGEHNHDLFDDLTAPNLKRITLSFNPTRNPLFIRLLCRLKVIPSPVLKELAAHPVDVLHYPGTTIDQPEVETPCILTVHDIQQEYFPEFFSRRELARRKFSYKPSIQKAHHIITNSEFTKNSLVEKYKILPHKITVTHFGVNPIFHSSLDSTLISQIRSRYNLPEQFIFFPANPWPHKNHRRLFEALTLLRERYGHQKYRLVLSGVFPEEQARLQAVIAELDLSEAIQVLGYIPYADLPGLYAAAAMLVFPSLFEGFGIPLLEAMASGCPIVSANTTSLPEVAGDAAVLVDPYNVEEMAEAIHTVLHDEALRLDLKARGLDRVKYFSWEKAARRTIEVYQSSLAEVK
jgi:glycosyltransferase involved in cell wall biosynthesis